jgi:hypothetical protein
MNANRTMATHLLPHGYWFFTQGVVPEGKDPAALDAQLLAKYDVASPKARRWRKSQGLGNVQYVRMAAGQNAFGHHAAIASGVKPFVS